MQGSAVVHILVVNNGPASVRLAAYRATAHGLERVALRRSTDMPAPQDLLVCFAGEGGTPDVVVHRVVPNAPSQERRAAAWVEAARQVFPDAAQVQEIDDDLYGVAHAALWRHLMEARPDLVAGRAVTVRLGAAVSVAAVAAGARTAPTSEGEVDPREGVRSALATLGGADAFVLGGGEPSLRERICRDFVSVDPAANAEASRHVARVTRIATAPVEAWVVPIDEEALLAEDVLQLCNWR